MKYVFAVVPVTHILDKTTLTLPLQMGEKCVLNTCGVMILLLVVMIVCILKNCKDKCEFKSDKCT